ncbi:hypothetical protein SAMN05216490_4715 [Mucilaginibacter mallensis]|uniref:Thiol-activated cytolysin n=2 Tax=Mucilaginibacter mallensis TaxID=652787 RepID=A0A1H2C823_MUCMA|nr:hypothetical protein SAMN05216490_4715 [Mucilaginibacter mallensis]
MNLKTKHDRFHISHRPQFYYLMIPLLVCTFCANAQVKRPAAKPVITTVPASTQTTAPAITKKPVEKTTPVLYGNVQHLTVKPLGLGDPAYEGTSKHAKRKASHDNGFDDTAKMHINGITIKLVKNPKFGGNAPTTYKAHTKKGSEHKEKSTDKKGGEWDCASSTVSLTANSPNFLSADAASMAGLIYPGAFYKFDDFFSGNPKPFIGAQHVLGLMIDNSNLKPNDNPFVNISNPNYEKVYTAVDKLQNELKGPAGTFSFNSTSYETSDATAAALQISGGGSYAGVTVSASYATSSESNTVNVTIDATKILYTIRVVPPDSGYFIDPNVENTKNLMVMGRVSYGVRVLANFTYTMNSSKDAETFKASYSGFGTSANVDLNAVSSDKNVSSTINCYVVGGPGKTTLQFNRKDLEKEIQNVFRNVTWQTAQPISYSFYDMADDVLGSYSNTDDFHERNCVPNDNAAILQSAYITYTTSQLPGENKDDDTHYHVIVYSGNAGSNNGYNGYDNNPPQTVNNGEPFLLAYKTGPLNITFNGGVSHQDPLTFNNYLTNFLGLKGNPTMDFFVKNGGLVHFHIYPNGHDTWGISTVVLTLNFAGGLTQKITWGGKGPDVLVLTQDSTEGTLYFDGTFKPRQ